MLNHVTLLGRLAQDPTMRTTGTGTPVASFDLAVNVPSKDKNAPPDYIPIVCWSATAELVGRYLSKGRQIVVEGRINTRTYTAQDGTKRKVVEVTASRIYFADSGSGNAGSYQNSAPAPSGYEQPAPASTGGFEEVEDDQLPF